MLLAVDDGSLVAVVLSKEISCTEPVPMMIQNTCTCRKAPQHVQRLLQTPENPILNTTSKFKSRRVHGQGGRRSQLQAMLASAGILTPAMAEAALNWTSEVKGCTSEPYRVIAMFMVTVPLEEELTGGTLGDPVTSAAVTGECALLELMGAWATAAETGAIADGVGAFAAPVELLMILIQAREESASVGPAQSPLRGGWHIAQGMQLVLGGLGSLRRMTAPSPILLQISARRCHWGVTLISQASVALSARIIARVELVLLFFFSAFG